MTPQTIVVAGKSSNPEREVGIVNAYGWGLLLLWLDRVSARWRRLAVRGTRRLATDQSGQSMVEYAIVAALIAVAAMAAVQALGGGIAGVFQNILGQIQGLG